jgi:parallel beta-helix repeat protein
MMNGRRNLDMVLGVCVFLAALAGPAGAVTYYVDPNGSADFTTIQAAIADANDYDEIEVAPATYNEAINFNGTITGGDANSVPPNGYGGGMFNNNSSPTVTNCIFSKNAGDSGGGMCNYNLSSPNVTNCTFSDNYAYTFGGGMCNENSSPMVTNCTFSGNRGDNGGGLYNYDSDPNVTDCNFSSNSALSGGGMFNNNSSPTVTNCSFGYNVADYDGGGMCGSWYSSPTVTNCTFSDNVAGGSGGGMYGSWYSSPTVTNCTFSDNTAAGDGGGMYGYWYSSPTVTNCTFSDNTADGDGGGMYNLDSSNATVANCILWGDTPDEIYNNSSSPVVTYCDVQGGTGQSWFGIGCIDADPCFVEQGYWADINDPNIVVEPNDPNAVWMDGNYRLGVGSPCIDAGDNNSVAADTADLDGDGNTVEPIPFDLKGTAPPWWIWGPSNFK